MNYREKDEKDICCVLCGETNSSPEYKPEIYRFQNDRWFSLYKTFTLVSGDNVRKSSCILILAGLSKKLLSQNTTRQG